MSGSGNLPDNVRAGGQVAVEHRQAGVANEIGETHFWRFLGLNGRELIGMGIEYGWNVVKLREEVVEIVVAAQRKHNRE